MSEARKRAAEADLATLIDWLDHGHPYQAQQLFGETGERPREMAARLRVLLAEEPTVRESRTVDLAALPVHFVAYLPRGCVFMHPDTPKTGVLDPWPPLDSMMAARGCMPDLVRGAVPDFPAPAPVAGEVRNE